MTYVSNCLCVDIRVDPSLGSRLYMYCAIILRYVTTQYNATYLVLTHLDYKV
jgi:hypothetical protein